MVGAVARNKILNKNQNSKSKFKIQNQKFKCFENFKKLRERELMVNLSKINVGDFVTVNVPEQTDTNTKMLNQFNGYVMQVSKKVYGNNSGYLQLDGAEGKNGMPYSFVCEWLTMA